jgi:hypothetical protein
MKLEMEDTAKHGTQMMEVCFLPGQLLICQAHVNNIALSKWNKSEFIISCLLNHARISSFFTKPS